MVSITEGVREEVFNIDALHLKTDVKKHAVFIDMKVFLYHV